MSKFYSQKADHQYAKCKFCDMEGLFWKDVGSGKFRLHETEAIRHDCPNFHKRMEMPKTAEQRLNEISQWKSRWWFELPDGAAAELDQILEAN